MSKRVVVPTLVQDHAQVVLRIGVARVGCSAPQFLGGGVVTEIVQGDSTLVERGGRDIGLTGHHLGHVRFPI